MHLTPNIFNNTAARHSCINIYRSMCGENHILMQKVYLLSKVCASNFNGQIACLSFVISVPWNLWGIFGSFAIFDEKYCSHSVTGYNFQAESGSSCDLKETKKVNTIRCWREMPPACRRRPLRVHGCLLKWCQAVRPPRWHSHKESFCQHRRRGSVPDTGRSLE